MPISPGNTTTTRDVDSPTTMSVVFLNRFFFPDHSATSQLLTDLSFFLTEKGARVQVITSRQRYEDASELLVGNETIRGVRIQRVLSTRFGRARLLGRMFDYLTFYVTATLKLWQLAKAGDVVVAMTDPPLIGVPAGFVCRLRKATLINWLQDLFPEVAEVGHIRWLPGFAADWLRRLRNQSIRRFAVTVVVGERVRAKLVADGISPERLVIIPNWADGDAIQPVLSSNNELRTTWSLGDKFVVGYSGNLGRAHEFETVVSAMEILKNEDVVFLFIGGGKQQDWLEAEARRRGIANIQFRPYQPRERLTLSLGVADVHLVTLLPEMEGLIVPSKFYGVAAAGRPTIFVGDPDGEIAGIVTDSACGLVVSCGDVTALAAAVLNLRDHRELLELYGRNARAVFDTRFDKKHAMKRWQEVVERAGNRSMRG